MFTRGISAGASGAIFAIIGAQLVFLYQNRQILGAQGRAWFQQTLIVVALNIFVAIAAAATPGGIGIDNWGHAGGFFAGIVLAWFIGPHYQIQQSGADPAKLRVVDANPRRMTWRASALYFVGMIAALIYSVVNLR
jgi:membrane associated rhomboid family serine protease